MNMPQGIFTPTFSPQSRTSGSNTYSADNNSCEEHQLLAQLKQALTDLTFSFSTNSTIITEQAKIRCKEVHNHLIKQYRDWVTKLVSSTHCYDVFYDTILYYCNLNQFHHINPSQHQHLEARRLQCLQNLRDCFGVDSLLLSDFYYLIALQLEKNNLLDDAVEFAGRALFIRLKCTGIVSMKSAESHFLLGCVYFRKEFDEESRKELTAARIVYSKLDGNHNMTMADCNIMLGQLELRCYNNVQAFSAFLKCYRSRFFILGEKHQHTIAAFTLLQQARTSGGSRFLSGIELKERVEQLKWTSLPQIAQPHVIGLFVNRLDDEHILTFEQLDSLVSAALVYHENIIANQRANYGNYSSRAHDGFSKDQAIAALSDAARPIYRDRCTSSSLSGSASDDSIAASLVTSPSKQRSIERPKQIVPTGSMKLTTFTSPSVSERQKPSDLVELEVESHMDSNENQHDARAITLDVEEEEKIPNPPPSANSSQSTAPDTTFSAVIIAPELSSNQEQPQIQQPSNNKGKRTWRPISLHSPLRIAATGGMSAFSNIDMQGKSFRLIRNECGGMYFVRKCSIEFLRKAFRSKVVALGLLAWLAAGNSFVAKKHNPLLGGAAANGPSSASAGGDSTEKSDAKNALNALFGKKLGGPPALGGPKPQDPPKVPEAVTKKAEKFASNPPRPPPLPNCWPPVPYTGEDSAAVSKPDKGMPGSDDAKDNGEGPIDPNAPVKPKLKQVFLTSLASIEGTFWAEPQEAFVSTEELFDDLEEEFAIAAKKKPAAFGGGKNPATEKAKPAVKPVAESVLDPQRTQNINIMLAKFGKKTMESIAEMVINMDAANLGASAITALSQFIPTPDEIGRVSKFVMQQHAKSQPKANVDSKEDMSTTTAPPATDSGKNDGSTIDTKRINELKIGKAEQYIYFMAKIKKMEKRLSAMSSILCAHELSKNIVDQSEILLNAVSEVKGSGRLKFLLKTFLDLNNTLSKYAKNGTVMNGINIASWSKLSQVKLNNGETAYQYVINKIQNLIPEALELSHDMPSLDEAKGVMLNRLSADVRKLEEAVGLLSELLTDDTSDNKDKEVPSIAMKNLTTHLEELKKMHQLSKERFELAQKDFIQCCAYYGESSPPTEPEALFGELSALCKSLQVAAATAAGTKQRRKALTSK